MVPREMHPVEVMSNIDFNKLFSEQQNESEAENDAVEQTPVETAEVVETAEEPTETPPAEEAPTEPARDEKGRFKQERNGIPVEALLEERTKRQELERQLAEERKQREAEAARLQSDQTPDPLDDKDAYNSWVKQQIAAEAQRIVQEQRQQQQEAWFNASAAKAIAANNGDKSVVDAVVSWAGQHAASNPKFVQEMHTQADPVAWLIEQQNRHALAEEFARDPDGFIARKLAEQSAAVAATAATNTTQVAAKTKAPKSIASIGSGNSVKTNDRTSVEEFEAIFNRKR